MRLNSRVRHVPRLHTTNSKKKSFVNKGEAKTTIKKKFINKGEACASSQKLEFKKNLSRVKILRIWS